MPIASGTWLLIATQKGAIWSTIRDGSGSWRRFRELTNPKLPGEAADLVLADRRPSEMHVIGLVRYGGTLWHSLITQDGGWTQFGDVASQTGGKQGFTAVGGAPGANLGELHIVAGQADGGIFHTLRRANGSWTPFGDVEAVAGEIGKAWAVACSHVAGVGLHVVVATEAYRIYHTIRREDGSWTKLWDVETQTGESGAFRSVACAASSDGLHVCAALSDDRVVHCIRRPNGSWTPFGDVEIAAGTEIGTVEDVGCAIDGRSLHVGATTYIQGTTKQRLFHALRAPNGSWTPFGDVLAVAGPLGVDQPHRVTL